LITSCNAGEASLTASAMAWLARAGSEVVLTARSEAKGQEAADRILRQIPQAKVRFGCLI
jgi:hypothetical protein